MANHQSTHFQHLDVGKTNYHPFGLQNPTYQHRVFTPLQFPVKMPVPTAVPKSMPVPKSTAVSILNFPFLR